MSDFNVTEAALWSQGEYDSRMEYLKNSGMNELAAQAEAARNAGKAALDEWAKIEEAAGKLSPTELAQVGKGPHLLKGGDQPQESSPSTRPKSPSPTGGDE